MRSHGLPRCTRNDGMLDCRAALAMMGDRAALAMTVKTFAMSNVCYSIFAPEAFTTLAMRS